MLLRLTSVQVKPVAETLLTVWPDLVASVAINARSNSFGLEVENAGLAIDEVATDWSVQTAEPIDTAAWQDPAVNKSKAVSTKRI